MFNFGLKKGAVAEKRQIKQMKAEAEKFEALQTKAEMTLREYLLWQLYHLEKEFNTLEKEKNEKRSKLVDWNANVTSLETCVSF